MCRHLLLVVSILCAAGCERFAHRYDYHGTLLQADGSPAAGRRVAVLPWERFFAYEKDVGPIDVLDHWTTVTDQDGRFSGSVNGGTTYLRWLCLPTAPAPPLTEVDLWTNDGRAWSKIPVPLDAAAQDHVFSGGRSISLPAVALPPAPATAATSRQAATRPAETSPEARGDEPNAPLEIGSATPLATAVGKRVRVVGSAVNDKPNAFVETRFYYFPVPELHRWPADVIHKEVVVTGVLRRRPAYREPEHDASEQSAAPSGFQHPDIYYLTGISWAPITAAATTQTTGSAATTQASVAAATPRWKRLELRDGLTRAGVTKVLGEPSRVTGSGVTWYIYDSPGEPSLWLYSDQRELHRLIRADLVTSDGTRKAIFSTES